MSDSTENLRGYTRGHKQFHSPRFNKVSVMIGVYLPDGSTTGQFQIEWIDLLGGKICTPRLVCFDDSWKTLYQFNDVLKMMSELKEDVEELEFCKQLSNIGITDLTQYKDPKNEN